jgi:hypothetical protein
MFTLTEKDGHVRLDMLREDYDMLLLLLGYTAGALEDHDMLWPCLEVVNDLNATNPQFKPYPIPAEHRNKRQQLLYALRQRARKNLW